MATTLNDGYLAAQKHWTERHGNLALQVRLWRGSAILSGFGLILALALAWYTTMRNPFKPFPVLIDNYGRTQGGGSAQPMTQKQEENVRQGIIEAFVSDMRTVSTDPVIQKIMIDRVYSRIKSGSVANTLLNEHYRAQSPYELAKTQTTEVRITNILRTTDKSFEAEWTETVRAANSGQLQSKDRWRGVFTVTEAKPETEKAAWSNALGVFVTNIAMSKTQEEQ